MDNQKDQYPLLAKAISQAGASFPELLAKKFARVLQRIELNWGSKDAVRYLDSLLLEDREDRQGFPLEAVREIVLIKQVHDYLFPSLDINPFDPFSAASIIPLARKTPDPETQPAPKSATEHPASGDNGAIPAAATTPPPARNARAAEKPVTRQINWPRAHTQHELLEYAELQLKDGSHIHAQQGQPLGDIFKHYQLVDERTVNLVNNIQARPQHQGKAIGQILVEIGAISSDELTCALCIQTGIIMVDALAIPINSETMNTIPIETARSKQVLPVGRFHNSLFLAVADPFGFGDTSFFSVLTGLKIVPVYAPRHEIINRLNMHGLSRTTLEAQEEFRNMARKTLDFTPIGPVVSETVRDDISENDSAIINLVNQMILHAIEEDASDIHIELFQGSAESAIRFRRDGHMEHFSDFPCTYHNAVVSRIKIMADLDIAEKRHPQDGKISFPLHANKRIDLRVATVPTIHGVEFVTIRILPSGEPLSLAELGMADHDMQAFREIFRRPYGLILVCGPTGSGKTTTLHSVLKELNTDDRKIWTAEDPVEIVQPHLCQAQVNSKIGLTFANMLRSFLRADPDVIMIGEMRDQETAGIALEASMTGHLVLSTLHTNSASETVARLVDLNIDPYNLSDALLAILAQRLARTLCTLCARREEASAHDLENLANEYHQSAHAKPPALAERNAIIQGWRENFGVNDKLYLRHPVGCKMCSDGYKGRIGLYELLQATPSVRHLIRQQSAAPEYQAAGIIEGMRTLKQDGIEKVMRGMTDMLQVRSACT